MRKSIFSLILIALVAVSIVSVINVPLGKAQSVTNVSNIIGSDVTWTQANSPYNINGKVVINNGATLTVETGTTINLNGYMIVNSSLIIQPGVSINIQNASGYIQVDGTLSAIGTNTNPIRITGSEGTSQMLWGSKYYSSLTFSADSTGWNEQTSSGSTIQNAILDSLYFYVSSSVKITNNTLNQGLYVSGGSPVICNNVLTSIGVGKGAPVISHNQISGGISCYDSEWGNPLQTGYIVDNVISGGLAAAYSGIHLHGDTLPCTLIIERNWINTNGNTAITVAMTNDGECTASIINNTLVDNAVGINFHGGYPHLFSGNNVYNNTLNVKLDGNEQIDCRNNWWGTTDSNAIDQTIHDFKDDFTIGTVTYTPFLTAPNTQAEPNPNAPIPTSNTQTITQPTTAPTSNSSSATPHPNAQASTSPMPSESSNQTSTSPPNQSGDQSKTNSSIDWTQIALFAALGVIVALVIVVVALVRQRKAAPKAS